MDGLTENPKIYGTQRNSTLVVNYDPALDPGRHTVVVFGNVGNDASPTGVVVHGGEEDPARGRRRV